MTIYKKTIVNVIELLFGKVNNSTEIMTDIVEIETRLAKIMCKFLVFFFLQFIFNFYKIFKPLKIIQMKFQTSKRSTEEFH